MSTVRSVRWCTTHNNVEVYAGSDFCHIADHRQSGFLIGGVTPGCVILDAEVILPDNADKITVEYQKRYIPEDDLAEELARFRRQGHDICSVQSCEDKPGVREVKLKVYKERATA